MMPISLTVMDNIPGNVGRLESDVLSHKPDLVVWQLGSNDAVWRGIVGNVEEMITDAVKRLKAANTDVVLVDLQYAPLVLASGRHAAAKHYASAEQHNQQSPYRHFLSLSRPPWRPQKITRKSQLSEKAAPLPRFIAHPQSPSCVLLQECRSATLAGQDQKTT